MISATLAIILITCLISISAFNNHKLLNDWILNPYLIYNYKQWWRMVTSGFLHADYIHLAVNMIVLYMFGDIMEHYFNIVHGRFGQVYYIALYVLGIIAANIYSVFQHRDNPSYNALGASGATSALVFAFVVLDPWGKTIGFFFIPPGLLPNIVFGGLYLLYCVYMSKRGRDNIGHEAHFFGALWGAAFMFITEPELFSLFIEKLL